MDIAVETDAEERLREVWSCWPTPIPRKLWAPAPTIVSLLEEGFLGLHWQTSQPRHCWLAEFSAIGACVLSPNWHSVLQEVVQRHLACRTCFRRCALSSSFQAYYERTSADCFLACSLTSLSDVLHESTSPVGKPPLKIGIHLGDTKISVVLVAHPVLLDAWSLERLLREFWALLQGRPLAVVELDRADFAQWQRRAASLGLWSSAVLRRVSRLREVKADQALKRENQRSGGVGIECLQLDVSVMRRLHETAAMWQVTFLDLMVAMFASLLHDWRQKLVFGLPHSYRPGLDILGCCSNTILVCLDVGRTSLYQAAQHVHTEMQSARRDGAAPLLEIVRALQSEGAEGWEIPYDVFYDMRRQHDFQLEENPKMHGAVRNGLCPKSKLSFAGLEIHVVTGARPEVTLLYYPEVISHSSIQDLIHNFSVLMERGGCLERRNTGDTDKSASARTPCSIGTGVAASSPLGDMRKAVAAALPHEGDMMSDDVPLGSLGLDSVSAVFLQGRLSELFGTILPEWLIAQASMSQLLLAVGLETPSSLENANPACAVRCRARIAADADWQALARIWREHHHLLEMVPETTRFLLAGPPAWLAAGALSLGLLRWDHWEHELSPRAGAGYFLLAVLQHFVHWLLARCVLAYDLSFGELKGPGGPKDPGWQRGLDPAAVILAEAQGSNQILGVVCVRVATRFERIKPSKRCWCWTRRRRAVRVASLWHAAVLPEARNQGAAKILVDFAQTWAREVGACRRLEAVCLNPKAKAACHNMGFLLSNPTLGCWPLVPAFFHKDLVPPPASSAPKKGTNSSKQGPRRSVLVLHHISGRLMVWQGETWVQSLAVQSRGSPAAFCKSSTTRIIRTTSSLLLVTDVCWKSLKARVAATVSGTMFADRSLEG